MLKSFVLPVNLPAQLLQKNPSNLNIESLEAPIFLKLLAKRVLTPLPPSNWAGCRQSNL